VHAADQAHLLGPHRIDKIVADVDMDHPANFERGAGPERQAGDAAAFEADRRLRDPRQADADRGQRRQPGFVELTGPNRVRAGRRRIRSRARN
jgi:hypothetical protein